VLSPDDKRNRLIGSIHGLRRRVPHLTDEDVWRDFLAVNAGVSSLRQMDGMQLGRVLDALTKRSAKVVRRQAGRDPLQRKVVALWLTLRDMGELRDASDRALDAFVKRTAGVDALRWADGPACVKVIEALKEWVRRVEEQRPPADAPP
jgi:hypothetical protein